MKNVMIMEKAREIKKLSKDSADKTIPPKLAWVSGLVDFTLRYKWAISNADIDVDNELRLTGIKKYLRRAYQFEIELN